MTEATAVVFTIHPGEDVDPKEVDRQTVQLLGDLRRTDVDSVERVREGEAPEGSMGLEVVALGSLLVKLGPAAIDKVADLFQAWLGRGANRTLEVKIGENSIVLTDASTDERRKLVDAVVAASPE